MKFLPEMMKSKSTAFVRDSDDENENEEGKELGEDYAETTTRDEGDDQVSVAERAANDECGSREGRPKRRDKKRNSDIMQWNSKEEEQRLVSSTSKRRRKTVAPREKHHSKQPESATRNEEVTKTELSRTLRRQSTMTQLVDGRRPLPGAEEPEFKPVKRSLRRSSSGKGKKTEADKQQRTLTQMIPGLAPLGGGSDSDLEGELAEIEAQDSDNQSYDNVISKRLAQQYFLQGRQGIEGASSLDVATPDVRPPVDGANEGDEGSAAAPNVPSVVIESVEDEVNSNGEDDYEPTQYIDAPITRTRRTPRRSMQKQDALLRSKGGEMSLPPKSRRPRFSLLSTPEKRRVREIPSSQSPPDSPLSTQVSPQKTYSSPVKRPSTDLKKVQETPSKRKQVSFQGPSKQKAPPPLLRRFKSTIQDSEDEEDNLIDEDTPRMAESIVTHTKAQIYNTDSPAHGQAIGSHTQAMLHQIDQACAIAEEDTDWLRRDSSEELGESMPTRPFYPASDLGEQEAVPLRTVENENVPEHHSLHCISRHEVKQEPIDDVDMEDLAAVRSPSSHGNGEPTNTEAEHSMPPGHIPSSPPLIEVKHESSIPSTPMAIDNASSDDEQNLDPAPLHVNQHKSTAFDHQSADLDGEPVQALRSPSAQNATQQSYSNKAEQQIQNEWLSYSQYVHARPPQSSSMKVAGDMFSYDATPLPPRNAVPPPQLPGYQLSQATTVDEMTPKKNRTQVAASANTTPHKIASSQPVVWEDMPPPLFIPSSFPSPTKVRTEGWSSPVLGRTQDFRSSQFVGSLEDFSIPPPPPVDDDWVD